jgi:hypothetical protein
METAVRVSGVALLIVLGVFVVLLPACMGFNYSPVRDVVVIKLDANGIEEWVRTIDGGQDDAGEDMAELESGELVIIGQNGTSRRTFESPRVIRLSSSGMVITDMTSTDRLDRLRAVVADPDGGFAILMQGGEVTRFDRNGAAIWTCSTAMWEAPSLTRLRDGGYLVGGYALYQVWATDNSSVTGAQTVPKPIYTAATPGGSTTSLENPAPVGIGITTTLSSTGAVGSSSNLTAIPIPSYTPSMLVKRAQAVRYSSDGKPVWQRTYGEGIAAVLSMLEDQEDGSLLLAGPSPYLSTGGSPVQELVLQHADRDGAAGPVFLLGYVESRGTVQMQNVPDGVEVVYSTWSPSGQYTGSGVVSTLLDPTGQVIGNLSLSASRVFNGTRDGGYISVGVPVARGVEIYESSLSPGPHPYTTFHALRFDAEGNLVWNRPLSLGTIREVKRVIQTADGGYAILAMTEKG